MQIYKCSCSATNLLQYFPCNAGTGFGIGEGVMMVLQLIATGGSNGVELMIRQMGKLASGRAQGVEKLIFGIVHLIDTEGCTETSFVEGLVVGNKGKPLDEWFYLCPYFGEGGCVAGVLTAKAMHL